MQGVKFYKAKYIIVWDEGQHKTLENGYLGVSGDTVTGFFTKIPKDAPFEDLGNVAITPGFINMHTHPCEVYSLKSYREDIGNPYFFEGTLYDYALVMLCYALETFVSGIVALFIAQKRYGIKLQIVSAQEVKFYLKDSIPFFSSTFLMRAYKTMNTLVLGFILGDFAVGLYTAAEKLHNAYSSFVSPLLSQIFYPYFTRIKNMGRATKMVLLLCIANTIALACIYFLSPYLIPIFIKTETASITTYFNLFLLLLAISVPADMFGFPYLGVLGKINEVNMTTIYSAIIYIIVVLVLILTHSISIGSVIWALIIANVGCLVLRLYLANKVRVGNVDKQ